MQLHKHFFFTLETIFPSFKSNSVITKMTHNDSFVVVAYSFTCLDIRPEPQGCILCSLSSTSCLLNSSHNSPNNIFPLCFRFSIRPILFKIYNYQDTLVNLKSLLKKRLTYLQLMSSDYLKKITFFRLHTITGYKDSSFVL